MDSNKQNNCKYCTGNIDYIEQNYFWKIYYYFFPKIETTCYYHTTLDPPLELSHPPCILGGEVAAPCILAPEDAAPGTVYLKYNDNGSYYYEYKKFDDLNLLN